MIELASRNDLQATIGRTGRVTKKGPGMDCATRGGRRRWLRIRRSAQCAALTRLVYVGALSTTGCTLSPSVNILGSFFPAWLICIVTGLVLALIVWRVLVVTAIAPYLTPSALVYPCLAALLIFVCWLVLFAG
jgi:YtcA family